MPYASLKQLRYMHAQEPEAAEKIDSDIKSSGERAINRKHNISTKKKSAYIGKADFFGRQGLKNANERLRNADKLADTHPTEANINSAKFAAKMRNKALLKRTVRLSPVVAAPILAAGVAGSELQRRKQYAPSGYNSGAYVQGSGQ